MKAYVIDTSALLDDPELIYSLGSGDMVVIPTAVIKELDIHKKGDDESAKSARDVARTLDLLGSYGNLAAGAQLKTGTILGTSTQSKKIKDFTDDIDNRIVGCALKLKGEHRYVAVVSRDRKMRDVARARGLRAKNYPFCLTMLDKTPEPVVVLPAKTATVKPALRKERLFSRIFRGLRALLKNHGDRRPLHTGGRML